MSVSLVYSLLGAFIVGLGLAVFSAALTSRRSLYLTGVVTACLAFLILLPLVHWLTSLGIVLPLILDSALSPAVEEPLRVFAIFCVLPALHGAEHRSSYPFAIGYAAYEGALKLAGYSSLLLEGDDIVRIAAILSTPAVPVFAHLFLGLLGLRLHSRGWTATLVLAVLFGLHTIHNALVLSQTLAEEDWRALLTVNGMRIGVFILLIALVARVGRRGQYGTQPVDT